MNTVDYHITVSFSICTCRILYFLSRYYKCDYLGNDTKKFMRDLSLHMRVNIISAEETSLNYYSINWLPSNFEYNLMKVTMIPYRSLWPKWYTE